MTRHHRLRRVVAILTLMCTVGQPVWAFDTFWHSAATGAATREFHFSADATNIVQFGNFSGPDFFGPLYEGMAKLEAVLRGDNLKEFTTLRDYDTTRRYREIRRSAIFLHFDNLHGTLNRNWKFNHIFINLLKNTQQTINTLYSDGRLNEGNKKMAILMTLGASLHVVQDFYSHSDWIHQDFSKFGLAASRTPWGKLRAPTWFEVLQQSPDPNSWPIKVSSGIYPPPADESTGLKSLLGVPLTHTRFNHDNSELFYDGESQVGYHNFPPLLAQDSPQEHQLYAVNTAAVASIEWVRKLEEDPITKSSIDYAKDWNLRAYNPTMLKDLSASLAVTLFLSCAASKWDGAHPPKARANECRGAGIAADGSAAAGVSGGAVFLPAGPAIALSFYNEFWAIHIRFDILKSLILHFGDTTTGEYVFPDNPDGS